MDILESCRNSLLNIPAAYTIIFKFLLIIKKKLPVFKHIVGKNLKKRTLTVIFLIVFKKALFYSLYCP
jgi:hypothetical protein